MQPTSFKSIESLDWRGLGRRRFLRHMSALGVAAAALSAGLPLTGCSSRDGNRRLLVLSPTHVATLIAVTEAVMPGQSGFPGVAETKMVERLDEELWFADTSIQDDMRAALSVFEWLPFAYGHFSRYSSLSLEVRRALLQQLMNSRIETVRAIATNLRLLTMFFYFGHASSWPAIGYDGPFQKLPPLVSEQRQRYAAAVKGVSA
jgi:hypothetical protein